MALTEEQIGVLEDAAGLVLAARRSIEDAVVKLTVARIFNRRITGALIDVCDSSINVEQEAAAEIEASS